MRCIKPNDSSESDKWDVLKVIAQLRSNGVVETIKLRFVYFFLLRFWSSRDLRAAGYGHRSTFSYFATRFSMLGLSSSATTPVRNFALNFPLTLA